MKRTAASKIIEGLKDALRYARCDHQWIWIKRATNGRTCAFLCSKCGSYKHEAAE